MDRPSATNLYVVAVSRAPISQLKKVEADVRKEKFLKVDFALKRIGVPGLTVAEERNAGRGMWSYPVENVKRVLLTVVVDDAGVKKVVDSICESASTGCWGDGRIAITSVEEVFDIASGMVDRSELAAPVLGA